MVRQGEGNDGREEDIKNRYRSQRVSGKVMERLWKDYGKMVNRDSGIVDNKEDRTEHTTESRVCYRVMA